MYIVVIIYYIGILNLKLVVEFFCIFKLYWYVVLKVNKVGGNEDRVKFIICFYFRDVLYLDGV